jgi:ectoine hydroxylase-related dioxygenase (phytanoyl-CoA dioxygenase family)
MGAEVARLSGDSPVEAINQALDRDGVVIVEDFFGDDWLDRYNGEVQPQIDNHKRTYTGVDVFDDFLGYQTVRLQGLALKTPAFIDAMVDGRLLGVMDHLLLPLCTSYLLSAGELIEIRNQETAQRLHTDNNSWPTPIQNMGPLVANAMVALTDFTDDNGATLVVPGSHIWPKGRLPQEDDIAKAVMPAGSVAIFTGDTIHAGGTSTSERLRRGLSISYCAGWLRPVENHQLNLTRDDVRAMPERARELLGYDVYDGTSRGNGVLGYYEMGSPKDLFKDEAARSGSRPKAICSSRR